MNGNFGWNDSDGPGCAWAGLIGIFVVGCLIFGVIMLLNPGIEASNNAQFYASQSRDAATAAVTYPQTIGIEDTRVQNNGAKIYDNKDIAWGSGDITFTVASASTASYTLTINSSYHNYSPGSGQNTVDVSVNGAQASTLKLAGSCVQTGDHSLDCSTSPIVVHLQTGQNTIRLFNETGWESPDCNDQPPYSLTDCQEVKSITLANNPGN